jgi:hypothetical protein
MLISVGAVRRDEKDSADRDDCSAFLVIVISLLNVTQDTLDY